MITVLLFISCPTSSSDGKKKDEKNKQTKTTTPTTIDADEGDAQEAQDVGEGGTPVVQQPAQDAGTPPVKQPTVNPPQNAGEVGDGTPSVDPLAKNEPKEDDDDDDVVEIFLWENAKEVFSAYLKTALLSKEKIDALATATTASAQYMAMCRKQTENFFLDKYITKTTPLLEEGTTICNTIVSSIAFGDKILEAKVKHNPDKITIAEVDALKTRLNNAKAKAKTAFDAYKKKEAEVSADHPSTHDYKALSDAANVERDALIIFLGKVDDALASL